MPIAASLFRIHDQHRTQLLFGNPINLVDKKNSRVAIFDEKTLVLYEIVTRRTNVYLFRGIGKTSVPYVQPAVNVLSHGCNVLQKRKVLKTLEWLDQNHLEPNNLDDLFWLKIQSIINSKRYGKKQLLSIIESHFDL